MDDELRRAERELDGAALARLLRRMPAGVVAAVRARLQERKVAVDAALAAVDAWSPRCHCGEVGEPWCAKHEGAEAKYREMLGYYRNVGLLPNWVAGYESRAKKDAQSLCEAAAEAGWPDRKPDGCAFPGCDAAEPTAWPYWPNHRYCPKHEDWGLRPPVESKARPRG